MLSGGKGGSSEPSARGGTNDALGGAGGASSQAAAGGAAGASSDGGSGGGGLDGDGGGSGASDGGSGGGGLGGDGGGGTIVLESAIWARRYGDDLPQSAYAIAVEPGGDSFLTGQIMGSVDFGRGAQSDTGGANVFVLELSSDGDALWDGRFGDAGFQQGLAIAVDKHGAPSLTGHFGGTLDFGGGTLQGDGGGDVFVAKLDENHDHVFSGAYGSGSTQKGCAAAVTQSDDVLFGGTFTGNIDFGDGQHDSQGGSDVFAVRFKSNGGLSWSGAFGNAGAQQRALAAATTPSGQALFAGDFTGILDFGDGPIYGPGESDIFVTRLEIDGDAVWTKDWGDDGAQGALAVAHLELPDERIALAGYFEGTLTLADELVAADGQDAFVAVLDADGEPLFARRIGGQGEQIARGVAFDADGNVVVAGDYAGSVDDELLPDAAEGRDAFVIKFDADGNLVWAKRFGADGDQFAYGVGTDGDGNVLVAGGFGGTIPLSDETLSSEGYDDVFVLKLAP